MQLYTISLTCGNKIDILNSQPVILFDGNNNHLRGLIMATQEQKIKAWNNAKPIRGKNPDTHRQDPNRDTMYKNSYGKNSDMGWEVDHIIPRSRGGSDATHNLQALSTSTNRSKGDSLVKKSRHSKGNK